MDFTAEHYEQIELLAGIGYTLAQIARFFKINGNWVQHEYNREDSDLRFHYDRGVLLAHAETEMKLLESAKSGNLTAQAMFRKAVQEREFKTARDKCINGEL